MFYYKFILWDYRLGLIVGNLYVTLGGYIDITLFFNMRAKNKNNDQYFM